MTINLFSPVPPTHSAIAVDTATVLPALARRAQITLWVHEKNWARSLEEHATIRPYDPFQFPWEELNTADATIYHLGNEPNYHGPIWHVSRQHPGIVVLHDMKLQHLFVGMVAAGVFLNRHEYLQMMDFYHPEAGRELGTVLLADPRSIEEVEAACPLTGAAIENAAAVAVHTREGARQLAHALAIPVAYVPLSAPPVRAAATAGALTPEQPQASGGICRVIVFGFLSANRRLHSFLTAWHRLPERERFRLDVYGKIAHEHAFHELVDTLGLADSITVHGFVTDEVLDAALAQSDLAINLRDPTMGEASASQLRIWQHGRPSLVTDIGWYATLPENTVARVRREREIEDIQMHLQQFLEDPARYQEIGRNGLRHVLEHHNVEAYVDGLMGLVAAALAARPRETVRWISGRVGWVMKPWFTEQTASVSLPRVVDALSELFDARPQ